MSYKYLSFTKQIAKATMCIVILQLTTIIPSLTLAGESEAYEHLYEIMDKYHNAFDVYTDHDAGGNHFYPSGWMGSTSSISLDSDETSGCYAGTSCIKITFTATDNNWAGIYWQEPENNWGAVQDAGYDITGTTKMTFWAKGENGGEIIEFFVGGINGNYPDSLSKTSTGEITLTNTWQKHTIYLNSKDLSRVVGGFGWTANSTNNTNGATFYLDDIKYDKDSTDELRFLVSFESISIDSPDKYINNACFVYDNALALLAFLASGDSDGLKRAKVLADAFVSAQNNDRYYTDGRLRNAYMAGDLIDNSTGKARLPGYTTDGKWEEDVNQVSTHTGNMAWAIIALLSYYEEAGGTAYLASAKALGAWIENETRDTGGSGGYKGGYEGQDAEVKRITWKSTEQNLDVYVAFTLLHRDTGDKKWEDGALHAKNFVDKMWHADEGFFWTGTNNDGTTNHDNIPVDIQAVALMAIGNYSSALSWAENNCYTEADGFKGFDFNFDRDGIWFEGTAQMAIAYQLNREPNKANIYVEELQKAQDSATNNNGKGVVAASHDGVTTGFFTENYGNSFPWKYYSRLSVAATAWYIFAEKKLNPYWGTSTADPTPDIKANDLDGTVTLGTDNTLSITVSLTAGNGSGVNCDWWIVVGTSFGWYYFDLVTSWTHSGSSYTDFFATYQGSLIDLATNSVLESVLPVGTYTFYFVVDTNMDGVLDLDQIYFDSVVVRVE